jgi:hypothetical protein
MHDSKPMVPRHTNCCKPWHLHQCLLAMNNSRLGMKHLPRKHFIDCCAQLATACYTMLHVVSDLQLYAIMKPCCYQSRHGLGARRTSSCSQGGGLLLWQGPLQRRQLLQPRSQCQVVAGTRVAAAETAAATAAAR